MTDTIAVRSGEQLPVDQLEPFLRRSFEVEDGAPLVVRQFGTGASNLTYLVKIGCWEGVLRRPPLGPIPPKAHDMAREFRILQKLHPVYPLAPKPFVFCSDESVLGSPFYVMERRSGVVLDTDVPTGLELTPEICRDISEAMIDRLVDLHSIDVREAGLDVFGHPEGFMERQVKGWISRYYQARTDVIPEVADLLKWMQSNIPSSSTPTLIHYDYKLNNVMFDSTDIRKIVGVFDWEMTAIGDPLADLGCTLGYWIEAGDPDVLKYGMGTAPLTVLPGFMSRAELIELYAKKSGRDVSRVHFYLTFAYFKLAVIVQQIYYRWKNGQTNDKRFARLGEFSRLLIKTSLESSRSKSRDVG